MIHAHPLLEVGFTAHPVHGVGRSDVFVAKPVFDLVHRFEFGRLMRLIGVEEVHLSGLVDVVGADYDVANFAPLPDGGFKSRFHTGHTVAVHIVVDMGEGGRDEPKGDPAGIGVIEPEVA